MTNPRGISGWRHRRRNFTATADFLNTLSVLDLEVFDASQTAVAQVSITGEGGTSYPGTTIPEPGTPALLLAAGLALRRARPRR